VRVIILAKDRGNKKTFHVGQRGGGRRQGNPETNVTKEKLKWSFIPLEANETSTCVEELLLKGKTKGQGGKSPRAVTDTGIEGSKDKAGNRNVSGGGLKFLRA